MEIAYGPTRIVLIGAPFHQQDPLMSMRENVDHEDIRRQLLADIDVPDAALFCAGGGLLRREDLWWLYDEHRIMADGSARLLATMHEELHDDSLFALVGDLDWTWYDHGRIRPGSERL